jgi:hypothetical protein
MQKAAWLLAALLVCGPLAWSQNPQQPAPQQRPTLHPEPGPTLGGGPRTASTTDMKKLLRIRTLYVQRIDNSLSDRLLEQLAKMGRFRIVTSASKADAILRGSCLESRRLKRVHSEVFIADPDGKSIWQDDVYRPYNPPMLKKAVEDTALLVVQHLEASINQGESR